MVTTSRSNTRSDLENPLNIRKSTMCPTMEDQNKLIVSQNDAEHQSHLGKVQEVTNRHLETLGDERRPEDISGRCVAEAHESDCLLGVTSWEERDENLNGKP